MLAALERAGDAVVIVDRASQVSYFNAAAEQIWGLDRAEVLGRHVGLLGLDELRGEEGDGGPADHKSEVAIQRQDGNRIRVALSVSHVEIGGQSRSIAFVRDITKEVVRRERMAVLNLVADKTNRAVVVTDRDLGIVYTNAAFTAMFGYSVEEAQGRRAIELLAGLRNQPQDAGKVAALGGERKPAARKKSSPTTRTATRSGCRPASRRSAIATDEPNTCSPC